MSVVASLVLAAAFAWIFRRPLQQHPGVFYAVAVALDVLLLVGHSFGLPVMLWRVVLSFHSRCLFALALFAVVMFIGTLRDGSRVKTALQPVRAELSIVASLLTLGHIANFVRLYILRLTNHPSQDAIVAFVVAVLLVVLLAPLTVTSFKRVKQAMTVKRWKALQRLAYVFWALVFLHVIVTLGPAAASGAPSAQASLGAYVLLFGAYAALRVRRWAVARVPEHSNEIAPALEDELNSFAV